MAKRGRKPKPTALKVLEGNPGKRPLNADEPQPSDEIPTCPDWLHEHAKEFWAKYAPELHGMGCLKSVDGPLFTVACCVWSEWRKAQEFLDKAGTTHAVKARDGSLRYVAQFPQVNIMKNMVSLLNMLMGEFGMSPSARSRLHVAPADDPASALDNWRLHMETG